MTASSMIDYLGALLNRPVAPDTAIRLSSAQRARFNAWLHAQGHFGMDAKIAGEFTISALALVSPESAAELRTVAPEPRRDDPVSTGLTLGIDLQSVAELTAGVRLDDLKADPGMVRIFTLRELSYAQCKDDPAQTLAGLFAAKEAIRKCVGGQPWSDERFRDVEVLPDEHGRPTAAGFPVSITHSAGMAAAVACRGVAPAPELAHAMQPAERGASPGPAPVPANGRRLERFLLAGVLAVVLLQLALLLHLHA